MQTVNILSCSGSSLAINLSQNNVIRLGFTHTMKLQLKFNGSFNLIQKSELKRFRTRGRPNRFLTKTSNKCNFVIT